MKTFSQYNVFYSNQSFFFCRFVLVASSWSECVVIDSDGNTATCGGGLQVRLLTDRQTNEQNDGKIEIEIQTVEKTDRLSCTFFIIPNSFKNFHAIAS